MISSDIYSKSLPYWKGFFNYIIEQFSKMSNHTYIPIFNFLITLLNKWKENFFSYNPNFLDMSS